MIVNFMGGLLLGLAVGVALRYSNDNDGSLRKGGTGGKLGVR